MKADEIVNLLYSPQWVAKLLQLFLSGASSVNDKGVKLELIYFVLPFVFDEAILNKLCSANKTSTFSSTFKDNVLRNCLIHKGIQIDNFRAITNKGLIYLHNTAGVIITDFVKIYLTKEYTDEKDPLIKNYCKAAYNLGVIFSKEDYRNVFIKTEIIKI